MWSIHSSHSSTSTHFDLLVTVLSCPLHDLPTHSSWLKTERRKGVHDENGIFRSCR